MAESDSDTQNTGIDNLINQNVDLIILVPFDAEQQIPAVEAAVDAESRSLRFACRRRMTI